MNEATMMTLRRSALDFDRAMENTRMSACNFIMGKVTHLISIDSDERKRKRVDVYASSRYFGIEIDDQTDPEWT